MDIFTIDNRPLDRTDQKAELKAALEKGENFQIDPGKIPPSEETDAYRMIGQVIRADDDSPYSILLRFAKER